MRTFFKILILLIVLVLLFFLLRIPVLRGIGSFLISEDKKEPVEVLFVLGGNSFDRGNEAARLYKEGYCGRIICMGENVPHSFKAIGVSYTESEMTEKLLEDNGVPQEVAVAMKTGTSTMEEAESILKYCRKHQLSEVAVLSDKFHTRRVRGVFEQLYIEGDKPFRIYGSPSSVYEEEAWWTSEAGLIMVNNEYVKLMYYAVKY